MVRYLRNFKEQFAEKRVHILRITPYFTYVVMAITYINTILILMTTAQSRLMMIAQMIFIVLLTIAFIVMYKLDDKGDVLGLEFDYLFIRNRPFKRMLKILEDIKKDMDEEDMSRYGYHNEKVTIGSLMKGHR